MPAPCSLSLAGQHRNWKQIGEASFLSDRDKMKESASLNVDERLRLARERREVHLKQLASREQGWLDREERAQRFYQKHLEERRKKLEKQRLKEEMRRNAVEEKRQQRLKLERERYELVVQKTMERSQNAKLRSAQRRVFNPKNTTMAKRRSLSQWEINLVNRLQTPTISFLARSRSAACLSRGEVSCHTICNSGPHKNGGALIHHKAMRSSGKMVSRQTAPNRVGPNLERQQQKNAVSVKVSSSPEARGKTLPSLTGARLTLRGSTSQECFPLLLKEDNLKCTQNSHKPLCDLSAATCSHEDVKCDKITVQENPSSNRSLATPPCSHIPKDQSVGHSGKPSGGTTDPKEASRLLAEKRRQVRLQRERDESTLQRADKQAKCETEEKRKCEEDEEKKTEEEERRRFHQQKEEKQERQRLDRETRFQKEESERQERKKRLEEIMKRTRKTDTEKPCNSLPLEEVIKLSSPAEGSMTSLTNEEDILPTVAFKERRSIRTLACLEDIQGHQRAEVI